MSSSVDGGGEPADYISAEQFNAAAINSGRTMRELAELIGVGRSMVHIYRREGVTRPRTVETVRRVMGVWLRDEAGNPYDGYTDKDLVEEVHRRLNRARDVIDQSNARNGHESRANQGVEALGDGSGRYTGTGGPPRD